MQISKVRTTWKVEWEWQKKSRELIRMLSSSTLEGADIPGTVFENRRKSLIKHCERSEQLEQKLIKNAKNR